jgi:preprotein translocase subunit SecY
MRRLFETLGNIWKIPDLKRKILFTMAFVILYRLGGHIPLPGISLQSLKGLEGVGGGGLLSLYDLFVGGALRRAAIFATGIMPYITASIILQLLGAVIPYFQQLQKMGEEGRRKINQYTRYGALIIATAQGWGILIYLTKNFSAAIMLPHFSFIILGVIGLVTGAAIIMWLGELITEKGIGNGMSILILVGIVARLPSSIIIEIRNILAYGAGGGRSIFAEIIILAVIVFFVSVAILLTQASRKIPVQYARRVVGRKVYGGQTAHLPIKMNAAGVIPIIFAQSVMFLPQTLAKVLPEGAITTILGSAFTISSPVYIITYGVLIVFFAYFYTAVIFNPVDVADNLKKYGGFIPGKRPGPQTSSYIDKVLTRVTLPGSMGLALIAILPMMIVSKTGFSFWFGGTSLLIIVGVVIDTLQQIETHLLMRHYDGFMKSGKIRGRR